MQLNSEEEATLEYLDHVAMMALPGVIAAMGRFETEEWSQGSLIREINVGKACYAIAWSMLRARRNERKQCEDEHEQREKEEI